MTSPHEILPPFRLAGGGEAGRRSDQGRKNTEEQCSVRSQPAFPNTDPRLLDRKAHPATCPSRNGALPGRRNKSKQSLWPCLLPHWANTPSLYAHLILLRVQPNGSYCKDRINVWNCPRFRDSPWPQTGWGTNSRLRCMNPPQSKEWMLLECALEELS